MRYPCVAVLGNYHGGIQANATAYFGSIHTSAANGTVIFHFRVFIDLIHFNNDIQFINVTLIQNELAEKYLHLATISINGISLLASMEALMQSTYQEYFLK